jgi:Zn-dependent peptidase ImmA (M78 family)/transcriptional regulator with XRE-family HTH domain
MQTDLDYVFGPGTGNDLRMRARSSTRRFVRSQDHLALAKAHSKGHELTAVEALAAFGFEKLLEAVDCGSAILPPSQDEPGGTLKRRRESLGLSVEDLTRTTGLSEQQILDCENPDTRSPIKDIIRLAEILDLDERVISFIPGANGDHTLAVRLRDIRTNKKLNASTVVALSEASWVVKSDFRLREELGLVCKKSSSFLPSNNYGDDAYRVWQHGYFLANKTRSLLGMNETDPINSIRQVCAQLSIPLVQTNFSNGIAGATVVSNGCRGIAINVSGQNRNVWVRRATIAHELGHLLWDSDGSLNRVRVDSYDDVERHTWETDAVEARANAFAIAFLAPLAAAKDEFLSHADDSLGLRAVMERFGISFTAARFHVGNALGKKFELDKYRNVSHEPTTEWDAPELFAVAGFPIETTSDARRGEFAGLVVFAKQAGLISLDTAAEYLQTTPEIFQAKELILADIFGIRDAPR